MHHDYAYYSTIYTVDSTGIPKLHVAFYQFCGSYLGGPNLTGHVNGFKIVVSRFSIYDSVE